MQAWQSRVNFLTAVKKQFTQKKLYAILANVNLACIQRLETPTTS